LVNTIVPSRKGVDHILKFQAKLLLEAALLLEPQHK
jgi:hypothetical protein